MPSAYRKILMKYNSHIKTNYLLANLCISLFFRSCQETSEVEIKEKVIEYVPSILNWIQRHCTFKGMVASNNLQITHVEAIEDNVWCPKYGIKGKIDLTVQASFRDQGLTKVDISFFF